MNDAIRPSIGAAIRQIRKLKNITLAQLGELVGLDNSSLSRIENGKQGVSDELIAKLATALDVKPTVFFEFVHPVPASHDATAQLVGAGAEAKIGFITAAPWVTPPVEPTPLRSGNETGKKWVKVLGEESIARRLEAALPDELKQHAGLALVVHHKAYLCHYMSKKVVVFGTQLHSRSEPGNKHPPVRDAIEDNYQRLLYRMLLAKMSFNDLTGYPGRHYLAAFVSPENEPDEPVRGQIVKEAGSFDIEIAHYVGIKALVAKIIELEGTMTPIEEAFADQMDDYDPADYE